MLSGGLLLLLAAHPAAPASGPARGDGEPVYPAVATLTAADGRSGLLADLDGDGRADALVVHPTGGRVSLLFHDGRSSFLGPKEIAVGSDPRAAAVADLNGDGTSDIAVARPVVDRVSVLLGLGGGAFAAPVPFLAGDDPDSIAAGDLDGDGDTDLVVASRAAGAVAVLPNLGGGAFGAPLSFPTAAQPVAVAVADLDGDGLLDVVAAGQAFGELAIHLGDGAGALAAPVLVAVGPAPSDVVAADLFGDGRLDVAATLEGSNEVALLLGMDRGLAAPTHHAVERKPGTLRVGDMDGDGLGDLVAGCSGASSVSVLRTHAAGFLEPASSAGVEARPSLLGVNDVDRDGRADVVYSAPKRALVAVLRGRGQARLEAVWNRAPMGMEIPSSSLPLASVLFTSVVGDFDSDGDLDLHAQGRFLSGPVGQFPFQGIVWKYLLLRGHGTGGFSVEPSPVPDGSGTEILGTTQDPPQGWDLDGDGRIDLLNVVHVSAGPKRFVARFGDGDSFGRGIDLGFTSAYGEIASFGDVNSDGLVDIVFTHASSASIAVRLGDGAGSFGPLGPWIPTGIRFGNPLFADVDGDGDRDLVQLLVFPPSSLHWVLGNGAGGFVQPGSKILGGLAALPPSWPATGDLDGDGADDVVFALAGAIQPAIAVVRGGNPSGVLHDPVSFVFPGGPKYVPVSVLDADGDGRNDVAGQSGESVATFAILRGGADGALDAPETYAIGSRIAGAGDFDGDGVIDAVVSGATGIVVARSRGPGARR